MNKHGGTSKQFSVVETGGKCNCTESLFQNCAKTLISVEFQTELQYHLAWGEKEVWESRKFNPSRQKCIASKDSSKLKIHELFPEKSYLH